MENGVDHAISGILHFTFFPVFGKIESSIATDRAEEYAVVHGEKGWIVAQGEEEI